MAQVQRPPGSWAGGDRYESYVGGAGRWPAASWQGWRSRPGAAGSTSVRASVRRVATAGGTVAAYVRDYAGGMQLMRHFWDAAAERDPAVADLDEGLRFPMCRPRPLLELFTSAGLDEVVVDGIVVPMVFVDFDDYWTRSSAGPARRRPTCRP
jgi:hypothetical protein